MILPRNKKEFEIFIAVISMMSVNIIAQLITGFEVGFNLKIWADTLKVIPIIWISVIALVLITHKPGEWLTAGIIKENSFGSHIIINILCMVFLIDGYRLLDRDASYKHGAYLNVFYKLPRNGVISFIIEAFIAQPIAGFDMIKLHQMLIRLKSKHRY